MIPAQRLADAARIHTVGPGTRGFQRQIDELEFHARHPLDLIEHLVAWVVHRADLHSDLQFSQRRLKRRKPRARIQPPHPVPPDFNASWRNFLKAKLAPDAERKPLAWSRAKPLIDAEHAPKQWRVGP